MGEYGIIFDWVQWKSILNPANHFESSTKIKLPGQIYHVIPGTTKITIAICLDGELEWLFIRFKNKTMTLK